MRPLPASHLGDERLAASVLVMSTVRTSTRPPAARLCFGSGDAQPVGVDVAGPGNGAARREIMGDGAAEAVSAAGAITVLPAKSMFMANPRFREDGSSSSPLAGEELLRECHVDIVAARRSRLLRSSVKAAVFDLVDESDEAADERRL